MENNIIKLTNKLQLGFLPTLFSIGISINKDDQTRDWILSFLWFHLGYCQPIKQGKLLEARIESATTVSHKDNKGFRLYHKYEYYASPEQLVKVFIKENDNTFKSCILFSIVPKFDRWLVKVKEDKYERIRTVRDDEVFLFKPDTIVKGYFKGSKFIVVGS